MDKQNYWELRTILLNTLDDAYYRGGDEDNSELEDDMSDMIVRWGDARG